MSSLSQRSVYFYLSCALLACGVAVRSYLWYYHKDLWLDEALLAVGISQSNFSSLLVGAIPDQSAPLLFLISAKFLQLWGFFDEHSLYLLPTLCGTLTLLLTYKTAILIKGERFAFLVVAIFSLSYAALYYSSEFKQYSCEMLIAIFYLYFFVTLRFCSGQTLNLKHACLFIFLLLMSSSSIFLFFSFIAAIIIYDYDSFTVIKKRIYAVFPVTITVLIFFAAYYFIFLNSNRQFMDEYWKKAFIPFNPLQWASFIKQTAFPVFFGLTGENIKGIGKYFSYALAFALPCGLYLLHRENIKAFYFIFFQFVIIFAAMFFCYPVGHSGYIGSRLVLFLLPSVAIVCGLFFEFINVVLQRISNKFSSIAVAFSFLLALFVVFQNFSWAYRGMGHQQISKLITYIDTHYKSGDKVAVYVYAPYKYYQDLNNVKIEPDVLYSKTPNIDEQISNILLSKNNIYILFSHYCKDCPGNPHYVEALEEKLNLEKRAFTLTHGSGSMLYVIDKAS